jgi:hypothetical protein
MPDVMVAVAVGTERTVHVRKQQARDVYCDITAFFCISSCVHRSELKTESTFGKSPIEHVVQSPEVGGPVRVHESPLEGKQPAASLRGIVSLLFSNEKTTRCSTKNLSREVFVPREQLSELPEKNEGTEREAEHDGHSGAE